MYATVIVPVDFLGEYLLGISDIRDVFSDTGSDQPVLEPLIRGNASYMTWANQNRRDSQKAIAEAYDNISRELGATLVSVGDAWEKAPSADSHLSLHAADGRHANPIGTHLTTCILYAVIYGATPEGLPGALSDQGVVLNDLPMAQARFLQRIAYQTVSNT